MTEPLIGPFVCFVISWVFVRFKVCGWLSSTLIQWI